MTGSSGMYGGDNQLAEGTTDSIRSHKLHENLLKLIIHPII